MDSVEQVTRTAVTVRAATASDAAAWDAFVAGSEEGTFFHRFAWGPVIEESFGHPAHPLLAERGGRITAVLPLVHKRSRLFGDQLISNAFCSYGGVAAADEASRHALEEAAMALGERLDVGSVEFRNLRPRRHDWHAKRETYARFRRAIPGDEAAIIKAVSSKGRRHELKKSLKQGLRFERHDDVATFHDVLAESYRNLGTPIYAKRYFQNLLAAFGDAFEVSVVLGPDGALAATMAFFDKGDVHPYYTGGRAAARQCQANDFLFLRLMLRGLERGCPIFDFGRSKFGTGSFDYKGHWGFKPEALNYEYKLVRDAAPPDLNPLNPKYRLMIAAWKRLPLWLSKRLGPPIVGQVG